MNSEEGSLAKPSTIGKESSSLNPELLASPIKISKHNIHHYNGKDAHELHYIYSPQGTALFFTCKSNGKRLPNNTENSANNTSEQNNKAAIILFASNLYHVFA